MSDQDYRCFLYKKIDGEVHSHIFVGQDAVDEAMNDGWHTTPAVFVNTVEDIPLDQRQGLKDAADEFATDANKAANYDKIESLSELKELYERMTGKKMHKRVSTLKGARNAFKQALGDLDGDSSGTH